MTNKITNANIVLFLFHRCPPWETSETSEKNGE